MLFQRVDLEPGVPGIDLLFRTAGFSIPSLDFGRIGKCPQIATAVSKDLNALMGITTGMINSSLPKVST